MLAAVRGCWLVSQPSERPPWLGLARVLARGLARPVTRVFLGLDERAIDPGDGDFVFPVEHDACVVDPAGRVRPMDCSLDHHGEFTAESCDFGIYPLNHNEGAEIELDGVALDYVGEVDLFCDASGCA